MIAVDLFLKAQHKPIDLGNDFLPPIEDRELSDEEARRLLAESETEEPKIRTNFINGGNPKRIADREYQDLY
jgi:hypothetical protein